MSFIREIALYQHLLKQLQLYQLFNKSAPYDCTWIFKIILKCITLKRICKGANIIFSEKKTSHESIRSFKNHVTCFIQDFATTKNDSSNTTATLTGSGSV